MDRTHLAIILTIAAILLTQPAGGLLQTMMVATGLAGGLRWWSAVGRRQPREQPRGPNNLGSCVTDPLHGFVF